MRIKFIFGGSFCVVQEFSIEKKGLSRCEKNDKRIGIVSANEWPAHYSARNSTLGLSSGRDLRGRMRCSTDATAKMNNHTLDTTGRGHAAQSETERAKPPLGVRASAFVERRFGRHVSDDSSGRFGIDCAGGQA
jgi:hypothetical protein